MNRMMLYDAVCYQPYKTRATVIAISTKTIAIKMVKMVKTQLKSLSWHTDNSNSTNIYLQYKMKFLKFTSNFIYLYI